MQVEPSFYSGGTWHFKIHHSTSFPFGTLFSNMLVVPCTAMSSSGGFLPI